MAKKNKIFDSLPETVDYASFISPVYRRKLLGQKFEECDDGHRVTNRHEERPDEDCFTEWVYENSYYDYRTTNGGMAYLMNLDGVTCNVCVREKRMSGGEVLMPKDHVYRKEVKISVQPKEKGLPKVLAEVLDKLGFEKV